MITVHTLEISRVVFHTVHVAIEKIQINGVSGHSEHGIVVFFSLSLSRLCGLQLSSLTWC